MTDFDDLVERGPFGCATCGGQMTADWLAATAAAHGVTLLAGAADGWLGWTCPGCGGRVANFCRLDKGALAAVFEGIREACESALIGRLCYRSFPYRGQLQKIGLCRARLHGARGRHPGRAGSGHPAR